MADSYIKAEKIINWMIAGKGISRAGSAGIPRDIDDRERKTVVWYTNFFFQKQLNGWWVQWWLTLGREIEDEIWRTCHNG